MKHVANEVAELRRMRRRELDAAADAETDEEREEHARNADLYREMIAELGGYTVLPLPRILSIGVLCCAGAAFIAACVSMGPPDWRPESHIAVMRACQAMCSKAGGAKGYSVNEGECSCRSK